MLRYDYVHYMALLIPSEMCNKLYDITNTQKNRNVNTAIENPSYNKFSAHKLQHDIILKDITDAEKMPKNYINCNTAGTDINRIVKTRIAQGAFRRLLFLKCHKCCLCNIITTSVLRASHIKEWADSSKEERIDSNNGLLLCANHDALFDQHLISFNPNSGDICISDSLNEEQKVALNLSESSNLSMSDSMKSYMQTHFKKFVNKENQ